MATQRPQLSYNKPPLSPQGLLQHLLSRGLHVPTADDRIKALATLEQIDYYRLLIYMRPLQRPDPPTKSRQFIPGTTFSDVLRLYEFDRQLRLLCMDAVERIEVALRAAIVSEVAVQHGAHFYLDRAHFTKPHGCTQFQDAVREEAHRNRAIKHYHGRYSSPPMPPIWVAMEAVTFGALSRLFSKLVRPLRIRVASRFAFGEGVLRSWFRAVNSVRNIAAHHGRLWDALLHVDMPAPAHALAAEFNAVPNTFSDRAVVMVALLANIDPDSNWKVSLRGLMDAYPTLDVRMGFIANWRDRPFWAVP